MIAHREQAIFQEVIQREKSGAEMSAAPVATLTKMIESLPDSMQKRVVAHLQDYIEDLRDESQWDSQFDASPSKLADAARKACRETADGRSKPLDHEAL